MTFGVHRTCANVPRMERGEGRWRVDLGERGLGGLAPGTRIRRFEASDCPQVHALLVAANGEEATIEAWTARLLWDPRHDADVCLLADTDEGELVGAVLATRGGEVTDVAVAEAWRRRGAARALLGRVLELFRRRGHTRVGCELDAGRFPAGAALLEALGFERVATPNVLAVHASPVHGFHKEPRDAIRLVEGLGVEGDAHAGETVQHRSRVRRDPTRPNLRQVHLLQGELLDELAARGFEGVGPGTLGENVTTRGIDLLALGTGTRVRLGAEAVVVLTGLRNPCTQLDDFRSGLLEAVLDRDAAGEVVRRAGVMAVVERGGVVRPDDPVEVLAVLHEHRPLRPV